MYGNSAFPPFQRDLRRQLFFLQLPSHLKPAAWLRQRPVFYRISGELMKSQPERLGSRRRQRDRRSGRRNPSGVIAVDVGGEFRHYESVKIDALILDPREQALNSAQRAEPTAELRSEFIKG